MPCLLSSVNHHGCVHSLKIWFTVGTGAGTVCCFAFFFFTPIFPTNFDSLSPLARGSFSEVRAVPAGRSAALKDTRHAPVAGAGLAAPDIPKNPNPRFMSRYRSIADGAGGGGAYG